MYIPFYEPNYYIGENSEGLRTGEYWDGDQLRVNLGTGSIPANRSATELRLLKIIKDLKSTSTPNKIKRRINIGTGSIVEVESVDEN